MITRLEIGIDISEEWFDACFLMGKKPPVERFANDDAGRKAFLERVRSFCAKTVHLAMEHTGGCETALALAGHEASFVVSLLDGLKVARYRESLGRTVAKNDREDARLIARYLRERKPARWSPQPQEYRVLTELVRHRTDLIETRKAWLCRTRKAPLSELVAAQRDCLLQVLNAQIKDLEKEIAQHIERSAVLNEAVELLLSVPGIGKVSAVRILAEMGPVENYATPRQLALAAGLCPIENQSGKSKPQGRLIVYGNRELRNALYMPALVAVREKTALADYAKRIHGNAVKAKKTVLVAVMRKLACVLHGILTHKKPYDPILLLKHMKTKN